MNYYEATQRNEPDTIFKKLDIFSSSIFVDSNSNLQDSYKINNGTKLLAKINIKKGVTICTRNKYKIGVAITKGSPMAHIMRLQISIVPGGASS